jgi:very-short-patch-repair endonuclease
MQPLCDICHTAPLRRPEIDVTDDHDFVIDQLAASQHGIVTREQLLAARVPSHVIVHRIKRSRLHRIHRGVYRVGPVGGRYSREAAGLLACGEGAVLSHRTAAELLRLIPRAAAPGPVHVSVMRGHPCRTSALVRVHRPTTLPLDECGRAEGMPITTATRTLLDLAGSAPSRALESAVARATRLGLTGPDEIAELLSRHPNQPGTAFLRGLLRDSAGHALARSEAESRLLALIGKAQLPRPLINVQVKGFEVDFFWRRQGLVAEMDGFQFHSSSKAFEQDRRRDALLLASGLRVVRLTWHQLEDEPEAVVARLTRLLFSAREQAEE